MTVWAVAMSPLMEERLYHCDSCQRARRPLFLARGGAERILGFACDTCLALGNFRPALAA